MKIPAARGAAVQDGGHAAEQDGGHAAEQDGGHAAAPLRALTPHRAPPRSGRSPMTIPLSQVDAFADAPFTGNPAAVCLLPEPREPAWMAAVAREMNLSETAFLVRREGGEYDLRWFTPAVEVRLCGHATLASAHVLWERGLLASSEVAKFHTKSGLLTATRPSDGLIELDFPARPSTPIPVPEGLSEALGAPVLHVGRSADDDLVELASEDAVRALSPDFARLASLPVRGVIVTARSAHVPYDFVSRFFAPAVGVNEDPVTGSAHCCLAPFWSERLGKREMLAYQASARGGVVRVAVRGDRVGLAGRAITVLEGELRV
jgi:PhzF family phenazine biosynthesis protein